MIEMLDLRWIALARRQPQLMRVEPQHVAADLSEAVDIRLTRRAPIDELDAELEGRLGLTNHLQRIDAGEGNVIADVGDGRLTDPDRSNLIRLDEPDFDLAQPLRKYRGGHPA